MPFAVKGKMFVECVSVKSVGMASLLYRSGILHNKAEWAEREETLLRGQQ